MVQRGETKTKHVRVHFSLPPLPGVPWGGRGFRGQNPLWTFSERLCLHILQLRTASYHFLLLLVFLDTFCRSIAHPQPTTSNRVLHHFLSCSICYRFWPNPTASNHVLHSCHVSPLQIYYSTHVDSIGTTPFRTFHHVTQDLIQFVTLLVTSHKFPHLFASPFLAISQANTRRIAISHDACPILSCRSICGHVVPPFNFLRLPLVTLYYFLSHLPTYYISQFRTTIQCSLRKTSSSFHFNLQFPPISHHVTTHKTNFHQLLTTSYFVILSSTASHSFQLHFTSSWHIGSHRTTSCQFVKLVQRFS